MIIPDSLNLSVKNQQIYFRLSSASFHSLGAFSWVPLFPSLCYSHRVGVDVEGCDIGFWIWVAMC